MKGENPSGFKPLSPPFSLFLCITDGKSGAENCFAQSHALAIIEVEDSIGLNRKCAIHLYYLGYSSCCFFLLSTYTTYFSAVIAGNRIFWESQGDSQTVSCSQEASRNKGINRKYQIRQTLERMSQILGAVSPRKILKEEALLSVPVQQL